MWNILIADDDVEILDYLSNLIPWKDNDMTICAKARNGTEALKILETEPVDILLTDITMPGLNGLDLIREAKKYRKDLKTIILTCHENFTYAKTAIDLGVCGYLVKYMLEPDSLLEALSSVIRDMSHEKEQEHQLKGMMKEAEKNRIVYIEKKLNDLFQNNYLTQEEIRKLEDSLHIKEDGIQIAALFFQDCGKAAIQKSSLLLCAVKNITAEIMEPYPVSLPYSCDEERLVMFFQEEPQKKQMTRTLLEISRQMKALLHVQMTIVVSMQNNRLPQFSELMRRLEERRKEHFYPGSKCVIWEDEEQEKADSRRPQIHGLIEKLHMKDFQGMEKELLQIFETFLARKTAPYLVRNFYQDFVRELEEALYRQGISDLWKGTDANSWEGYRREACQALFWFQEAVQSEKNEEIRDEIRQVTDYMKQNLQKKITCEMMAGMVNMNVTYFSKLFKKETGEGFSNYLCRIRSERATMLLQHSNLSMEEITEQVGLSNMHYFYRMYKKYTGNLPGEVRRKY